MIIGILIIGSSISTLAVAKTITFSYDGSSATGHLFTSWSLSGVDNGYAKTTQGSNFNTAKYNTASYVEAQLKAGGPAVEYRTAKGTNATGSISLAGVWRFNSSHYIDQGSNRKMTETQTDW